MSTARPDLTKQKALTPAEIHTFLSDGISKALNDFPAAQNSLGAFKKSFYEWNDALNTCGYGQDAFNSKPEEERRKLLNEEKIKFEAQNYLECKFLLSLLLKAIYQARINREPAENMAHLRQLQQCFLNMARASNDPALQSVIFAAHVEHYADVMEDASAPPYYLQSHIGFMLRAQDLGQFGDNDFNAVRYEARQKTKIIEANQVDLNRYPQKDPLNKTNSDAILTLGDLHGNALKLLHFLIKYNVIDLKAGKPGEEKEKTQYMKFAAIYQKDIKTLTGEDKRALQAIIEGIRVINRPALIQLIGDTLCDRGGSEIGPALHGNDEWTLEIFKKLALEEVPLQIPVSNHDAEFLSALACLFSRHIFSFEARNPEKLHSNIIHLTFDDEGFTYQTHLMTEPKHVHKSALGIRAEENLTQAMLEEKKYKILELALKNNDIKIINYQTSLKSGQDATLRSLVSQINCGLVKTDSLPKNLVRFLIKNPDTQIKELNAALEIADLACEHYLPNINLVNYHIDEETKHINLYVHATAGVKTILEIAHKYQEVLLEEKATLEKSRQTPEVRAALASTKEALAALNLELVTSDLTALSKTIDAINAEFHSRMGDFLKEMKAIKRRFNQEIVELSKDSDLLKPEKAAHFKNKLNRIILNTLKKTESIKDSFDFLFEPNNSKAISTGTGFTNPFARLIWQRYYEKDDLLAAVQDQNGYVKYHIGYVHGHGARPKNKKTYRETEFPHVKNIETDLGKTDQHNIGTLLVAHETKSKYSPLQSIAIQLLKNYLKLKIAGDRRVAAETLINNIAQTSDPDTILGFLNQARNFAMEKDQAFNANKPNFLKRNQNGSRFHTVLNKIHTNLLASLEEQTLNRVINLEFEDLQNLLTRFDPTLALLYDFTDEKVELHTHYGSMLDLMINQFPPKSSHYLHSQIKEKCALISSYFNLSNELLRIKKSFNDENIHISQMAKERSYQEKHLHLTHALIGAACALGALLIGGIVAAIIFCCMPAAPAALVAAVALTTNFSITLGLPSMAAAAGLVVAGLAVLGSIAGAILGAAGLKIKSFYDWCCCCLNSQKKPAESLSPKPVASPSPARRIAPGGTTTTLQATMPEENPVWEQVVQERPSPPPSPYQTPRGRTRQPHDLWSPAPRRSIEPHRVTRPRSKSFNGSCSLKIEADDF